MTKTILCGIMTIIEYISEVFYYEAAVLKIVTKYFDRIFKVKRVTVSAVILAAGSSVRFGGKKTSADVGGKSVLERTLSAFDSCKMIDEIILVLPESGFKEFYNEIKDTLPEKVKKTVRGGDTRQKSALNGLEACHPKSQYIAIHDAARCMITPDMIETVCREAIENRAAAAAQRVVDTVKYSDEKGFIDHTIDRENVWLVSTPQVFMMNMYRAAAYTARDAGFEATDDCMLAERLGFKVKLVDVGSDNIKITYQDDIPRALEILHRRGESI